MKQTVKLLGAITIVSTLFSCSQDDISPSSDVEPTNHELIQGTWRESNVTHNGVVSTTQVICNGERELYTFEINNSFTERIFDDNCIEENESGDFTINETSFTLTYQDSTVETYNLIELSESILKFNFNDSGIVVEQTYTKVNN